MDFLQKFTRQFRNRLIGLLVVNNVIIIIDWWLADQVFRLAGYWLVLALVAIPLLSLTLLPWLSTKYLTEPTKLIWQAILHLAPSGEKPVPAPKTKNSNFGRELVSSLTTQLYQTVETAEKVPSSNTAADLGKEAIARVLPLPLFAINKDKLVVYANSAALSYIKTPAEEAIGKNFYTLLDLSFPDTDTLDNWLAGVKGQKVTASRAWSRVRLKVPNQQTRLEFDMAAYYNEAPAGGFELLIAMFDQTSEYSKDDNAFNFVALTVHELRNPLTLLRGYIEAVEEDLAGKLSEQDAAYMQRMSAAGQQLAAVVNNILNAARIEDNQFLVQLGQEQWPGIVKLAVNDMQLRAAVRGITIETNIAADLPPVAVDRLSIYEVLCNLLDNAIKYSNEGQKVIVRSQLNQEGLVETTIQDFGVGIPESILPNLFEKFYRSHRTRDQISGTGIGLYLCKTIVSAHSGNIWAKSLEGRGSIFGFTVLPYAKLSTAADGQPPELTRTASGWIKNHSLYRR